MNRKLVSLTVLLMFALSTLACLPCGLLGGKEAAQPTPEISKPTAVAPTAPPEPTTPPEPTPAPAAELGEEHRNFGGFAFQTIAGYTLEEEMGFVFMEAPDADPEFGPFILLMGGVVEETTTKQLFDDFASDAETGVEISEPREITVGGVPGLVSDLSGDSEGTKGAGQLVIVAVTPTQRFVMGGLAPSERWDDELAPLFDAVLASVSFFEPTASSDQPAEAEPPAAAEEEEPASDVPTAMPNLTGLPLLDDAEEVYCMDEYNLNYWTRVDLVTALTFYRQELPALGWQLDYQDGKCLDDRRLTRRCMGWHGGYDNPEETPLFFLRGDGEYLTLNASEEAGRVNIIISIEPDVYAD
jgi:hypothetical protein